MFGFRIDHYLYFDLEAHAKLDRLIALITKQGIQHMATSKELKDLAIAAAAEVAKFGDAVNALEAAVTAALAKLPTVPADVQADIDEAFATVQGIASGASAAVADAADGVDEAAAPAEPPAEG